jgi:hypothetical protein
LGHSSNIYTTGWFSDTVDFDPGAGTFQVSPGNFLAGAFVLKLSTSGQFVWARYIGGTIGLGISVSDSGKIYTTGQFQDTSDFDPSASIYPLIAYGSTDAFIHKMNQGQGYNQQIMNLVGTCFPNPVTQYLTVVLNNASEIEIYSNTGILLKTYPAKKEHLVDVSGYNAGLFFIKTPNGALKFVK